LDWNGKNYHPLRRSVSGNGSKNNAPVNAGKSLKTKGNIEWAINTLRKSESEVLMFLVTTILASDVCSWLARQNNLKPNSYNELSPPA
jgi:hypothetical protein